MAMQEKYSSTTTKRRNSNMMYSKWIIPMAISFLIGISLVSYLTVHPLKMSQALFFTCLLFFILIVVLAKAFGGWRLFIAIPLCLVFFLGGYYFKTHHFLSRDDPRPVPEMTRAKSDLGKGHTAVVYFTHGEPETYDPIGWINQFREFDEQKIKFIPFLVRPYFVYMLRDKYLQVGKSDHRSMHKKMIQSLEKMYRDEGDDSTKFYLSFLDDNPRPDAAAIRALNEGASKIIVCEVFLTISNHTAEGEELIENLHIPEKFGIDVKFTGPLWDSETLKSMFVHRANANIGHTDKSKVGILLVGHGQPDEWDQEWSTETEQEIAFRQEVIKLLAADGYKRENMSLAWMEFKEPKPAPKVEEFVKNGIEKLLFFSAAISADAIHSQYDIPDLVHEAKVPEGFPIINLGAWNDDPIVIKAIKEKIDEHKVSPTIDLEK
jgi:protoheme ferro-lyase